MGEWNNRTIVTAVSALTDSIIKRDRSGRKGKATTTESSVQAPTPNDTKNNSKIKKKSEVTRSEINQYGVPNDQLSSYTQPTIYDQLNS